MSKISDLHNQLVQDIQTESTIELKNPYKIDCKVGTIQSIENIDIVIENDVKTLYVRNALDGIELGSKQVTKLILPENIVNILDIEQHSEI